MTPAEWCAWRGSADEQVFYQVARALNCTVSVTLCDGESVTGAPTPVAEKPAPDTPICEMVTFEFPVFAMLTLCEAELPVLTLPKLKLAGLTDRV